MIYTQIEGYYTGPREPRNKHVLWIDNSKKEISLKVYNLGKWKSLCSTEDEGLSPNQLNQVESLINSRLTSFSTSITAQLGAILRDIQLEEKRASTVEEKLNNEILQIKNQLDN